MNKLVQIERYKKKKKLFFKKSFFFSFATLIQFAVIEQQFGGF